MSFEITGQSTVVGGPVPPSEATSAEAVIARNSGAGVVDLNGVARDLLQLSAVDPEGAQVLAAEVGAQLDVTDRGGLSRAIATETEALRTAADTGSQEGVGSFFEGAILGDFGDNKSWSATGGQIVGGLIPFVGQVADARDTVAAIGQVWNGEEGGWVNLGAAAIGWVPGIGDAAKAGIRGTRQTIDAGTEIVQGALRNSDEVLARIIGQGDELAMAVSGAGGGLTSAIVRNGDETGSTLASRSVNSANGTSNAAQNVAQGVARVENGALVLDANRGAARTIDGTTYRIGEQTPVRTNADGDHFVTKTNGDDAKLRKPATFDDRTVNADGSVTYTKNGESVDYDVNGFPVFTPKVEIYLQPGHIDNASSQSHFRYANEAVGEQLKAEPSLAAQLGLNQDQVKFLTKDTASGKSPPGLTWHHHQDTGRMQLVE
ncbi:MAG: HNH endonuclease, partial [Pseudomonadota bacterium]